MGHSNIVGHSALPVCLRWWPPACVTASLPPACTGTQPHTHKPTPTPTCAHQLPSTIAARWSQQASLGDACPQPHPVGHAAHGMCIKALLLPPCSLQECRLTSSLSLLTEQSRCPMCHLGWARQQQPLCYRAMLANHACMQTCTCLQCSQRLAMEVQWPPCEVHTAAHRTCLQQLTESLRILASRTNGDHHLCACR